MGRSPHAQPPGLVVLSEAWLALLQASQPGVRRWVDALKRSGSPEALLGLPASQLHALGLGEQTGPGFATPDGQVGAQWRRWLEQANHHLITYGSDAYPVWLQQSTAPPLALWLIGPDPALLKSPQLAIVGSRNPTVNGRQTAVDFARALGDRGLSITSGLACGIDAAAHSGALAGSGSTIAVLGCGIDTVYPRSNRALADAIVERGLIVSEYPPGTPVRAFQFPQRNRIIAGLSLGTLVVQATRRSGSLITAGLAAEYGRDVFAVPGSIHNPLSRGCHRLLREGAKLVEEVGDVLVELAVSLQLEDVVDAPPTDRVSAQTLDPTYKNLLNSLGFGGTRINDLVARTGLTAAELSSMLLVLELEGQVEAMPGGRYALLAKRS